MTGDQRTVFISGASRGIGLAIACRCAATGANVILAAKTDQPHPKLPGTIHTAADAVRQAGGRALPVVCDVRDEASVSAAVAAGFAEFGGIDAVVNNASAISLTRTPETPLKRYDLMADINARGTFAVTQACLPHLLHASRPHILTISPPLDFAPRWFQDHAAYSLAKYSMTILTLAWASEFAGRVAANCLWPRTTIDTAAVRNLLGGAELAQRSRRPEIMAEAAELILAKPVEFTGWCCLDDLVLRAAGVTDFDRFAVDPTQPLAPDFFVPKGAPLLDEADGEVGWRTPTLAPPAQANT